MYVVMWLVVCRNYYFEYWYVLTSRPPLFFGTKNADLLTISEVVYAALLKYYIDTDSRNKYHPFPQLTINTKLKDTKIIAYYRHNLLWECSVWNESWGGDDCLQRSIYGDVLVAIELIVIINVVGII